MAARFQDSRDLELYLRDLLDDTSSDESEDEDVMLLYDAALAEAKGKHGRCGRAVLDLGTISLSRADELFRFIPYDIIISNGRRTGYARDHVRPESHPLE